MNFTLGTTKKPRVIIKVLQLSKGGGNVMFLYPIVKKKNTCLKFTSLSRCVIETGTIKRSSIENYMGAQIRNTKAQLTGVENSP